MVNLDECGYAEWERSVGTLRAGLLDAIARQAPSETLCCSGAEKNNDNTQEIDHGASRFRQAG